MRASRWMQYQWTNRTLGTGCASSKEAAGPHSYSKSFALPPCRRTPRLGLCIRAFATATSPCWTRKGDGCAALDSFPEVSPLHLIHSDVVFLCESMPVVVHHWWSPLLDVGFRDAHQRVFNPDFGFAQCVGSPAPSRAYASRWAFSCRSAAWSRPRGNTSENRFASIGITKNVNAARTQLGPRKFGRGAFTPSAAFLLNFTK